jgi:hypothetical protein
MRARALAVSIGLVFCGLAASCSSTKRDAFTEPPPADPAVAPPTAPELGGEDNRAVAVTLKGTVYAPNGSLPLSNALVYYTSTAPDAIPDGAYCDQCVTLEDGTFAVSAPDGSFELSTEIPKGERFLVVQKGQFRRVRPLDVDAEGTIEVPKDDTTLPGKADPAKGDDVPKMLVLKDDMDFDHIDESLTKLGITGFEVRTDRSVLDDLAELMKYHVVFIPCGDQADPHATSPQSKDDLQQFVQAGGKLYVTDWSYEFVRQPFPGYLAWDRETASIGSAATGDEWDAPATATDDGLASWLAATGDASFEVQGNWTTIRAVSTQEGVDPDGNPVDIEPKVWVTATKDGHQVPTTVSFEDQCGRVLFSTYHTESGFGGSTTLLAQEKALLYVLLEVGVCVGDRPGVH